MPNLTPECVNTIRRARANRLRRPETKARNLLQPGCRVKRENARKPKAGGSEKSRLRRRLFFYLRGNFLPKVSPNYVITRGKGNGPGGPAGLQNPVAAVMRGLEGSTPSPFRHNFCKSAGQPFHKNPSYCQLPIYFNAAYLYITLTYVRNMI